MPTKARRMATAPVCDVVAINQAALARVRKKSLAATRAGRLAKMFRLLGNATRVRILDALGYSDLCVCDLAALLNARISAVSHQLALLKKHRLVRSRRDGKLVFYALDDRHVRALVIQGLAHAGHIGRTPGTTGQRKGVKSPRRGRAQVEAGAT